MNKTIERLELYFLVYASHFSFYAYIFVCIACLLGAIIALARGEWFSTIIFSLMTLVGILFFKSIKKQYNEEVKDFKKQLEAEWFLILLLLNIKNTCNSPLSWL